MSLNTALARLGALQASLGELAEFNWDGHAAVEELRAATVQCESLTCVAATLRHQQQRHWARSLVARPTQPPQEPAKPAIYEATRDAREARDARDARDALQYMETGDTLTMYLPTGKKKHDRFFWLENGNTICWDKKRKQPGKANKAGVLISCKPSPTTKTAQEWFEFFDKDNSGTIDTEELSQLYRMARGEKLKKKEVCPCEICFIQATCNAFYSVVGV